MNKKLERPEAYRNYLERLVTEDAGSDLFPDREGAGPESRQLVSDSLRLLETDLYSLSHSIHANPETAFEEHHAAAVVAETLSKHGIEAEVGAFGLDTSFVATAGDGRPRVAILAEYDALPGIGHGCGHNVICAAAVGAFLAVAAQVEETGGSVLLIGCPAEEGGSGKELIARAGGFEDVDCAMMVHPAGSPSAACTYLGMRQVEVSFHGLGAHASAVPYMGRNALDACVAAYTMIGQLRQHMLPDDRIHGVITHGGDKPNIIPDHAAAMYYVRSRYVDTLVELTDRMDAIFQGAAAATGTNVEVKWDINPIALPVRNNMVLANRFALSQSERGHPMPLRSPVPSGSTDMGNVSVRVPSIHPKVAVAPSTVPIHTAEFAKYAGSSSGDLGVLNGAFGLAVTALDYLSDADIRADVAAEFERSGGPLDVAGLER